MFKKAIAGIAMVAAASVAAQAQDNLEASHSAGHLTSGGSAIYVGGAYTHSWTDIDTGGFNTVGTFFNFDCAGTTIGGRTCDDTDNASGGSIVVGITNIYSFNDMASVRGELEYNYRGGTDYVTGSFPGPPGPPGFLYSVAVSGQHTGFVNAYIDLKMPNWPVTVYAGGGIGVSGTRVATNDFVVAGTASDTDFAFNLTAGGRYAVTDRIDLFGDVRYVNLGTTNVPMTSIGGGGPAGNFTVDHESIDIRLGITVKLGEITLPWNN